MRKSLCLLPIVLLLGQASASATSGATATSPGDVLSAWSQFVSDKGAAKGFPTAQPKIELRYVVASGTNAAGDAVGCDDFAIAYTDSSGTSGVATGGTARDNPDAYRFPIIVCSLALKSDWAELRLVAAGTGTSGKTISIAEDGTGTGVDVALPGPHKIGRRHKDANGDAELLIATMGDSGCRGASGGQNCDFGWPFQRITELAAEAQPDLFLHVGDYRYYKQYDSHKRWDYWQKDLLLPARRALLAAPWAFTRGNHEECSHHKSGVGFTFLFGVGNAACTGSEVDVEPSWSFDVAPGGIDASGKASDAHRFVMIDTSDEYSSELKGAFTDAINRSKTDSAWWVSHVPPVHLLNYGGKTRPYNGNVRYQLAEAIKNTGPLCDSSRTGSAPCRPSLILLGHDHMFQTVTFGGPSGPFTWPQIYIVGHGGVDLRSANLSSTSCTFRFKDLPGSSAAQTGTVHSRSKFGYVMWRRSVATTKSPTGWIADPRDDQGNAWQPFSTPTGDCDPKPPAPTNPNP